MIDNKKIIMDWNVNWIKTGMMVGCIVVGNKYIHYKFYNHNILNEIYDIMPINITRIKNVSSTYKIKNINKHKYIEFIEDNKTIQIPNNIEIYFSDYEFYKHNRLINGNTNVDDDRIYTLLNDLCHECNEVLIIETFNGIILGDSKIGIYNKMYLKLLEQKIYIVCTICIIYTLSIYFIFRCNKLI